MMRGKRYPTGLRQEVNRQSSVILRLLVSEGMGDHPKFSDMRQEEVSLKNTIEVCHKQLENLEIEKGDLAVHVALDMAERLMQSKGLTARNAVGEVINGFMQRLSHTDQDQIEA